MNENPPTRAQAAGSPRPDEPVRKPVIIVTGILLLVCVGGMFVFANRDKLRTKPGSEAVTADPGQVQRAGGPANPATGEEPKAVETTGAPVETKPPPSPVSVPAARHTAAVPDTAPPRVEPSPVTRAMVTTLTQLDLSQGPLTPEKAAEWKQNLQQLAGQGAAAVPAIREFLEKNLDLNFDATSAGLLGQSSLRMSFLEALQTIGGPEAMAVSSQMLQTTLDPREISWLATSLEQQAPGQYGQMAASAAREALAMASSGQMEGRDVGPLFGVLTKYGGPEAVSELEKFAGQYRYYATIALANMPDGAGINSLIQMVQDPEALSKGGRAPALQMLAQAALQSPAALQALADQARQGQIPTATWLNIASILTGDKMQIGTPPLESGVRSFHLASGNQNFYTSPDRSPWTADQVNTYTAVVDKLLANNNNPTAVAALQNARTALQGRLQPPP
jgi:hypothetical protein